MGDKAHPFQTAELDAVLEEGTKQLKASKEARTVHARVVPQWANEQVELPMRRRRSAREAAPPESKEVAVNGPTPERLAKDPEWQVVPQQGGQALYRGKSAFDSFREHLNDVEAKAAERLRSDAEWSTRQRTICQRTYTGMVFTGMDDSAGTDEKRAFSMARFQYVMERLPTDIRGAAFALIIAARRESDGVIMTPEQFARTASSYGSKNTFGPFTAGYIKCLCAWLNALQNDFVDDRKSGVENAQNRRRLIEQFKQEAATQQQTETDELVAKLRDALAKMEALEAENASLKEERVARPA